MSDDAESFLGVDSKPTSAVVAVSSSTADTSATAKPSARTGALFRNEDYWPYLFGIFVFAGLLAIPIIWGQILDQAYERLVFGSLVGCGVFAYAHSREGQFLFGRFIAGFALVFLISMRVAAQSAGGIGFIPGGFLGFIVMSGGGWLGIGIARVTGIAAALRSADSSNRTDPQ